MAWITFFSIFRGSMYEPYAGSTRLMLARQTLARRIRALKDEARPLPSRFTPRSGAGPDPLVAANTATREAADPFYHGGFRLRWRHQPGGGTNHRSGELHAGQIVPGQRWRLEMSHSRISADWRQPHSGVQIIMTGPDHRRHFCPRPNTDDESIPYKSAPCRAAGRDLSRGIVGWFPRAFDLDQKRCQRALISYNVF